MQTLDIQARCAALGFHPGPIDGLMGPRTRAARAEALEARGGSTDADLFHPSGVRRLHLHWTAGKYRVIDLELRHYNGVVDRHGGRHMGLWSFEDQAHYRAGVRGASHTLNFNTGAASLSMDAMHGAKERPFDPGPCPMTWEQIDEVTTWGAEICEKYDLPPNKYSVPTHSEIQPIFGVRQRWKWDINWLPDMDAPGDPIEVGDRLRNMIADKMHPASFWRRAA